jgi:electron transfer flavoprotein beta subunit
MTPDTTSKISFNDAGDTFNAAGVQYIMNPYDEWYALVRALELKESLGGTVTCLTVGAASDDTNIRKALAIGADDAIRVDAQSGSAFFTASQIAAQAKSGGYDIIFLGKETIDYNGAEVGGMVAEMLDLPYISFANQLDLAGNVATISREIEGGNEIVEVDTPFVVSAAKGLAEQRIPNMQGIMKARMKPLNVVPAVPVNELSKSVHFDLPPAKTGVKLIDPENMEELVSLLHNEAKII